MHVTLPIPNEVQCPDSDDDVVSKIDWTKQAPVHVDSDEEHDEFMALLNFPKGPAPWETATHGGASSSSEPPLRLAPPLHMTQRVRSDIAEALKQCERKERIEDRCLVDNHHTFAELYKHATALVTRTAY